MKKDNSTLSHKLKLRKKALLKIDDPVILETHSGYGVLFDRCYRDVKKGVAFDLDREKITWVAKQRPEWMVYQADSLYCIKNNIDTGLKFNFIDIDPYGSSLEYVIEFLKSSIERDDHFIIVANDGLRAKLKISAWEVKILKKAILKFGSNSIYKSYLGIVNWMINEFCIETNHELSRFGGYYCGKNNNMTHYIAEIKKGASAP